MCGNMWMGNCVNIPSLCNLHITHSVCVSACVALSWKCSSCGTLRKNVMSSFNRKTQSSLDGLVLHCATWAVLEVLLYGLHAIEESSSSLPPRCCGVFKKAHWTGSWEVDPGECGLKTLLWFRFDSHRGHHAKTCIALTVLYGALDETKWHTVY